MTDMIPVFDGHNDVLLRLLNAGPAKAETLFIEGRAGGHIDLPRAREGGFAGGMFAIFPPPVKNLDLDDGMKAKSYDMPLPPELGRSDALSST
ncbi:membrane dipeptidase, partial [Rhizobiaceae sp. 2RAB30]